MYVLSPDSYKKNWIISGVGDFSSKSVLREEHNKCKKKMNELCVLRFQRRKWNKTIKSILKAVKRKYDKRLLHQKYLLSSFLH